ncbi:MAG: hypothetical protein QOJ97_271 [Solirubrobacteraceae bacterium]|jgi:hypothetical protein|nr:hypothetical protein [Solirubrobacteraceae bacterium]
MQVLRSSAALAVAFLVLSLGAVPAVAAPGPTVTVRIEGENDTLLPRTAVTTSTDPVPGSGCAGTSVAGAIEVATGGNWDRQSFTQTILSETHAFANNDYWAEWLNNKSGGGICSDMLAPGDEVVMLVDFSSPTYAPSIFPVVVEGVPATAQRGTPFTVTVVEYYSADGAIGSGTRTPVQGATVSGGGASAVTGADGKATLSMPAAGSFKLKAVKSSRARSAAEPVCVHDGNDGTCGTPGPGAPNPTPPAPPPPPDTRLPAISVTGISPGQRFSLRRAPRLLRGVVDPGPAGVHLVRFRLRRAAGGRCTFYSAVTERFRPARCASPGFFYRLGDRPTWEYLLPARLAAGIYVLDVRVMDRWGREVTKSVRFTVLWVS